MEERIAVGPSRLLALALVAVHGAAAGVLGLVSPSPSWWVPAGGLIGISLAWLLLKDALLRAPGSIVALELRGDGAITAVTRDGGREECFLLRSTYVSPQVTVVRLRLRGRGRARSLIVLRDNVDPGQFRRLRTWLKWKVANVNPVTAAER
jgi:hypothetical protein